MKTCSHLTLNRPQLLLRNSRHVTVDGPSSSCLQTHLVSVKQQWLLSYLKMQDMYSKWAFLWFNIWIGYAVKVLLLKQNFWLLPQNSLLFWPTKTRSAAEHFCFFLNCRLSVGQKRSRRRHHIVDRSATRRCLIGFVALRHIYLMLAKWNFFAFMRLSKLSIYPENNWPDFCNFRAAQ